MGIESTGRRSALKALSGLLVSSLLPDRSFAAELRRFRILMTPEQSGVYNAYAVMQTQAQQSHPWLRPIVVETGGFNYNVKYIAQNPGQWKDTMLASATVLEWAAKTGVKPFYPVPLRDVGDLRIIGSMGRTASFWVTFDPAIRTPRDFAGKSISTGLLSQNEWGMYPRMLLDGWGITSRLKSFNALGPAKNIDAMLDRKVDAAMMVTFYAPNIPEAITPAPFNQLLAANRPFHYVDIPEEMIRDYNSRTGAPFTAYSLKANSLPKQARAFTSFGNEMTVSAHKSFPDDLAYEFAKLWVKMGPVVARYNALGKLGRRKRSRRRSGRTRHSPTPARSGRTRSWVSWRRRTEPWPPNAGCRARSLGWRSSSSCTTSRTSSSR